jgi:hypothetical protein
VSLFIIFWVLDFDGTSSVVSPWCPCAEHFVEEVSDVSRGGLGFRLTQTLNLVEVEK